MKLTKAQQNELEVWKHFIPSNCDWGVCTEKDIEMFFEWSEQGKHKDYARINTFMPEGRTYFHALLWGKKRAYMNVHELYEDGILSGDMPYNAFIDKHTPISVLNFIKNEIFKGADAKLIQQFYESCFN